jgi:hypothetical protein
MDPLHPTYKEELLRLVETFHEVGRQRADI